MIPVYISSHGFGHVTRCLAIVEEILETTDNEICLVSGDSQVQFSMAYLARFSTRVTYHNIITDVGLINEEGKLTVDKEALSKRLNTYIDDFESIVSDEVEFLKDKDVRCILTDITCLGIEVAKRLNVKSIATTNFTWLEQYSFLELDSRILDFFEDEYSKIDYVLLYDLATVEFKSFIVRHQIKILKKVGLVARHTEADKVRNLKKIYEKPVFVSFGRSTNMNTINIDYDGSIISTAGTNLEVKGRHIELMQNTLDTQNFIAASELVISKAGWGTIAEALVAGVPLVLVEREGVLEDTHHIKLLKEENLCVSIKEDELKNLNINKLRVAVSSLSKDIRGNNTKEVVRSILSV